MRSKKKVIKNIIVFLLLIILTFLIIFKNYDFKTTINIIINADKKYIFIAVITMFLNFTFESLNIKLILSSLGNKISLLKALKYTLIGFFFSGITPASSGGQPMEIYYMNREGIPVNNGTLALLVEVCSFHIVTITSGLIGAIINVNILKSGFIWIFIIGITLNLIASLVMFILLFSNRLSSFLIELLIKILSKFKYQNLELLKNKIQESLSEYHKGSLYIKKHKLIFIRSIFIVFIQVLMYYSLTYFVYKSFNLNEYSYFKIITIQAMLFISISSIPLPGSVGVSESAFLKVYQSIFGASMLASGMILYRGINFYFFIIISLLIIIINNIIYKKSFNN